MLLGRKTWEWASSHAGPGRAVGDRREELRLLAHADERSRTRGAELVTSDAGEFVRKLKSQPGKDIIVMSGGNFATSLLQAGVIDEIGLNIHPVLLGGGPPAFLDPGVACEARADGVPSARWRMRVGQIRGHAVAAIATGRTLIR